MTVPHHDARDYVRVKDIVRLEYRTVEPDNYSRAKDELVFLRAREAKASATKRGVSIALESPADQSMAAVVEAIKSLERKVDLMIELLERPASAIGARAGRREVHCNISGSGMLFSCDESFEVGHRLLMSMYLGYLVTTPIHVIAEVVRVEESRPGYGGERFLVAAHFTDLANDDRERIIQHVVDVQRSMIRASQWADERTGGE
ncbi:MAG: PilZ domain-containing protein [Deltaproteobacteria bacterium]|nr:PilZ domain-containing protein [Deltaproteobacteria bacterium]